MLNPREQFNQFALTGERSAEAKAQEQEIKATALAREIQELRGIAATKEDFIQLANKLKQLERIYSRDAATEQREAREILGTKNVLGPEEVKAVFGIEIKDVPEIPYSKEDLEKAKSLGEMLVLRTAVDNTGNPLTMARINEIMQPKYEGNGTLLLGRNNWYVDEPFYLEDAPKSEWRLVTADLIPDSVSLDYVEQTRRLRDYLAEHGFLTDEELNECSDSKLSAIAASVTRDWKEAAKQLAVLGVNKNHRRSPVESIYDLALVHQQNGERLLKGNYEWTARVTSDGGLVRLGGFGTGGVDVGRYRPGSSGSYRGVVCSR